MSKSLKQATSFQEQANILRQKGIIVNDTNDCIRFLSHVNYYRLSGYLLPFVNKSNEQCIHPVDFDSIVNIYQFDAELRNLLSIIIEKIEIHIRTQLAYYSAHHYGADGYMSSVNYNQKHDHIKFSSKVNQCISENSKSLVVKHHIQNYAGRFPIWVIIDYFSLGMLSYFFTGMKNQDKSAISGQLYHTNYQTMSSWLRCITDLRNRCAHYSRLYYWIFSAIPKTIKGDSFKADRTLFSQIYMLKYMYPEDEWEQDFIKPMEKLLKKYKNHVSREHIGFPYRWRSLLRQR